MQRHRQQGDKLPTRFERTYCHDDLFSEVPTMAEYRPGDKVTVYPFLKILPASQYVDLMIKYESPSQILPPILCKPRFCLPNQAVDNMVLDSALQHVNSYLVCLQLGESVEAACSLYRRDQLGMFTELKHVYRDYVQMFNEECMRLPQFRHMWLHALDKRVHEGVSLNPEFPDWPASVHFLVGRALYSLIYDRVRFNRNEPVRIRQTTIVSSSSKEQAQQRFHSDSAAPRSEEAPALFEVCTEYPEELRNEVKIHPALLNWYRDANYPPLSFHPAELPMLCPPVPWTSTKDAGYLMSRNYATRLIRHSNNYPESIPVLNDDLDFDSKRIPAIFDALNCLASCPWRVNEPILDGLIEVARAGGSRKLGVPERVSRNPSESLCITKSMSYEERRRARRASREAWLRFNEARSLWANELYRLSIANQYRGRVFWFPHSMDFRGRVYPCPPHFHHMGSDISRGLIVFAKGMPLGPKGLDWLKIHLVNLTGLKKRCSNNERLEFANTILDDVLDSAINPFKVEAQRREDAAAGVPVAQILENFVRRKVIKQSVMTTVYGVTLYGASEQIRKQLRDLDDFPGRNWIGPAASYLARSTLTSIGRIFTSSAEIQAWFGQVFHCDVDWIVVHRPHSIKQLAQHISGQLLSRVSWETPMGLPITQPYIRLSGSTLYSNDADDHPGVPDLSSKVTLPIHTRDFYQSISQLDVPVPNPIKQKNAFPPNFIHSLDSCHMMLTALHCLKAGITFASVHDCFWTHAATVDICREEFIALHSEPILQNFADYLRQRFAYSQSEIANMTSETRRARAMAFNQLLSHVPKQGLFDLSEVRNSTYFFS
ncbi:DNA-directed RNA polymerase [Fasciola gigantica]|uniref:DNA-directed RNA polymerase n=1 Tax=Fasciola gigantica TaxID=46835 RepID=A0A504ZBQ1_FASGI|nr:DNA-directed RNA polymerase [Fasciola gigantica]